MNLFKPLNLTYSTEEFGSVKDVERLCLNTVYFLQRDLLTHEVPEPPARPLEFSALEFPSV